MPVNSPHPQYAALVGRWQRMRDAIAGSDAVHAAGARYLPALDGQTKDEYRAYSDRAAWLGATGRTLDCLHGLVVRKPPQVQAPDSLSELVSDVDMAGHTVEDLASDMVREMLAVGRTCLVVDYPSPDREFVSAAAAAAAGMRPMVLSYKAEDVLNWREARVNGINQLVLLVLRESAGIESDGFSSKTVEQLRVLRLDGGVYTQEVWRRKDADGEWFLAMGPISPTAQGRPLTYIPALVSTAAGITAACCEPPLMDLADLNFSHFRTSADLEHGAHFTGLPTAVVSGYTRVEANEKLSIGSTQAWVFSDPSARASYLEFSGQGLGALEKLLDRKEQGMAALGARLLTAPKAGVESAQALEIRTTGETSMLAAIAATASRALTIALIWARDWAGASGDVAVEVNSDFALGSLQPQELQALVAAWQAGAISYQTLHHNLRRGELVPEGVDAETELEQIGSDGPQMADTSVAAQDTPPAQSSDAAVAGLSVEAVVAAVKEAIASMPAPQITVQAPAAAPAPSFDPAVLAAAVAQAVQAVLAQMQPAAAPTINVAAPEVPAAQPQAPKNVEFVFDADGAITGARLTH